MSSSSVKEHEYMIHVLYASAVGSLMYAVVCIRPNLSQVVSIVSRYMHDPDKGSLGGSEVDSTIHKRSIDIDWVFKKDFSGKQECIDYIDSDYAGDLDKHRYTMGYVFTLFKHR